MKVRYQEFIDTIVEEDSAPQVQWIVQEYRSPIDRWWDLQVVSIDPTGRNNALVALQAVRNLHPEKKFRLIHRRAY